MNFRSILSFHASINSSGAHALWANPLTLAFCKKKLQTSPCGDKCGWGFRDEGCCLHNYYWEVTVTNVQANEELFRPTRVLLRFTPTPHPHPSFKLATSLRVYINNFSTEGLVIVIKKLLPLFCMLAMFTSVSVHVSFKAPDCLKISQTTLCSSFFRFYIL